MSLLDLRIIKSAAETLGLTVVDSESVHTCKILNADNVIVIEESSYPIVKASMNVMLKEYNDNLQLNGFKLRVNGINSLHRFLVNVSAELQAYLVNGYKLKDSGGFYKKDKLALSLIIKNCGGDNFHMTSLKVSGSVIQVYCSTWIKTDNDTCNGYYYNNWTNVWLLDDNKPCCKDATLNDWTVESLVDARAKLRGVQDTIVELKSVEAKFTHLLGTKY